MHLVPGVRMFGGAQQMHPRPHSRSRGVTGALPGAPTVRFHQPFYGGRTTIERQWEMCIVIPAASILGIMIRPLPRQAP